MRLRDAISLPDPIMPYPLLGQIFHAKGIVKGICVDGNRDGWYLYLDVKNIRPVRKEMRRITSPSSPPTPYNNSMYFEAKIGEYTCIGCWIPEYQTPRLGSEYYRVKVSVDRFDPPLPYARTRVEVKKQEILDNLVY